MDLLKLQRENKIILYGGMGGFFLSLILGGFAGNPIVIVVVRAVISSFVLGLLLYGGVWVLKRYIPEIIGIGGKQEKKDTSEDSTGSLGKAIDYSIGEKDHTAAEMVNARFSETTESSREADLQEQGEPPLPNERSEPDAGKKETEEVGLPSLDALFNDEEDEVVPDFQIQEERAEENKPAGGDYISIGKVKIPNEPEIIAKAIKKVMKEDEYK